MEGFLGIGGTEFVIILIFAFLIFGPDKLPEIARTIGRAIAKFRAAQNEVNEVIKKEVYDPTAENPLQKAADKAESLTSKPPQTESFAERKARYDKIRAERKAKEEAARAEAAKAVQAQKEGAAAAEPAVEPSTAPTVPVALAAAASVAAPSAEGTEEIDIDALMGLATDAAPKDSKSPASANPAPEGGEA